MPDNRREFRSINLRAVIYAIIIPPRLVTFDRDQPARKIFGKQPVVAIEVAVLEKCVIAKNRKGGIVFG